MRQALGRLLLDLRSAPAGREGDGKRMSDAHEDQARISGPRILKCEAYVVMPAFVTVTYTSENVLRVYCRESDAAEVALRLGVLADVIKGNI